MAELQPCPLCGAQANVSLNTVFGYVPWCENEDCALNENLKGFETKTKAIEAWNSGLNTVLPDFDIDPTGTTLRPGRPETCQGNGKHPGIESCCDNCSYYLACFPEYDRP